MLSAIRRPLVVAVSAIFVLNILIGYAGHRVRIAQEANFDMELGPEYPLSLPEIYATMEDSDQYAIYGEKANEEWVDTTPTANGYTRLGKMHRIMTVAFGHEMHCVRGIRVAIAYPTHPIATPQHASHCLNYLRLSILCNPDLTLEKFDPLERNFTVDRFGATHLCRDWRRLYQEFTRNLEKWNNVESTNFTV